MSHKIIVENWREYLKAATNAASDTVVRPIDIWDLKTFAEQEADRLYPKPIDLDSLSKNDPAWRKGHDQDLYSGAFRHILGSFMIEHKLNSYTKIYGHALEVYQWIKKHLADLFDAARNLEFPKFRRHDPDDREADLENNILGISLAEKYKNQTRLEKKHYVQIVKKEFMNSGDFWTKATLGSGKILKYKDLLIARNKKKQDPIVTEPL